MNIKHFYIALVFLATGLASCSKFTDVAPKGKIVPKTVADYEAFMNDIILANAGYVQCEFMSDDMLRTDASVTSSLTSRSGKGYLWMPELFTQTEDDAEWNAPYNAVYYCNLVLQNIDAATNGADSTKERLKGEALVLRSYYFFHLANLYGKDYTAGNTDKNLAVPVITVPDLEAKTTRATVDVLYGKVIADLNTALAMPSLPDVGRNYIHASKTAAMALLARVYFFMGDYEKAAQWADAALQKKNTLLDYNTFSFVNPAKPYSGVTNKPVPELNPEDLYPRTNSQSGIFVSFMISPDLLSVFDTKDLRYVYTFTNLTTTGTVSPNPYPNYLNASPNFSIGVPEMMLIKAEYLARIGDADGAVAILNTLRKKRFKPADYADLTAKSGDDALMLVLAERRRELMYHGLRWFDLKRLNHDDRFKKVLQRTYNGQQYSLAPNSNGYVMQIAPKIIGINPAIIQNDRN